MLVVKEIDSKKVHTFTMVQTKKNNKGEYIPVIEDGQTKTEDVTFYETGEIVNGMAVVSRAMAKNDTHVLLYVPNTETK